MGEQGLNWTQVRKGKTGHLWRHREVCGNIKHVKNNGGGNKDKGRDRGGRIKNRAVVRRCQERGCCNDSFTLEIISCSSAVVPCWDREEGELSNSMNYISRVTWERAKDDLWYYLPNKAFLSKFSSHLVWICMNSLTCLLTASGSPLGKITL